MKLRIVSMIFGIYVISALGCSTRHNTLIINGQPISKSNKGVTIELRDVSGICQADKTRHILCQFDGGFVADPTVTNNPLNEAIHGKEY